MGLPPPPPKGRNTKKYFVLVIIVVAIIIGLFGLIFINSQFQGIIPVHPVSTPAAIADVTLSPTNQIVALLPYQQSSSYHQPIEFNLVFSQNGNTNLQFPYYVQLYDPSDTPPYQFLNDSTYLRYITIYSVDTSSVVNAIQNYGTYRIDFYDSFLPYYITGTLAYDIVIQDSTGAKITSNTVSVQYK